MKLLQKSSLRVVLVTAPRKEAEALARALLKERLIACANLLPGVVSLYWWEGKIERGAETLIVMKTPRGNVKKLFTRLKELHSYSVPEFLALAPLESNPDYERWAGQEAGRR
jgi:periplasmic divalent cation tolerance protein